MRGELNNLTRDQTLTWLFRYTSKHTLVSPILLYKQRKPAMVVEQDDLVATCGLLLRHSKG